MKNKIYIVEDQAISRFALIEILEQNGYNVVGSAASADKAWDDLKNLEIDAALLDVNLAGELDGVWLAQKIRKNKDMPIFFLSAYGDNNTLERVASTNPNGYLMKPYNAPTLLTNLAIAINSFTRIRVSENKDQKPQYIFLKTNGKQTRVNVYDIRFVKSEGNYLEIEMVSGRLIVRDKLTDFIKNLPTTTFVQTHRRFVVNREKINAYNTDTLLVGKVSIPISKTFKATVKDLF